MFSYLLYSLRKLLLRPLILNKFYFHFYEPKIGLADWICINTYLLIQNLTSLLNGSFAESQRNLPAKENTIKYTINTLYWLINL